MRMNLEMDGAHPRRRRLCAGSIPSDLRSQIPHYLMLLFLLLLLGVLMLYPVVSGTSAAFKDKGRLSFFWIASVLQDKTFLSQLGTSLALAFTVTFFCNLVSFPLALIASRYDFAGKKLLAAIVLVPMVLPPFVGAIGMKQFLGAFGSLTVLLQHLHILGRTRALIGWDGAVFGRSPFSSPSASTPSRI